MCSSSTFCKHFSYLCSHSRHRSIGPAFQSVHHFNVGQTGTVFVAMMLVPMIACVRFVPTRDVFYSVGCFAGEAIQLYQEKLYAYASMIFRSRTPRSLIELRKYYPIKGPEARLFAPMLAALLFPAGMFIYAWTTSPSIPWIGMVIGIFVSSSSQLPRLVIPDRKSTRLNSSHSGESRMPSSA